MFLFKRKGIYYIEYFDETENRVRRKSTKKKAKNEALKFLSEFSEKLANTPKLNYITLSSLKDEYLGYVKIKYSPKYHEVNELTLRTFIDAVGNLSLRDLKYNQIESFILIRFNTAKYSAHLHFRNLRAIFNYAVERKYISENPLSKFKFPQMPKSLPTFIDETELRQIIAKVDNETLKDMYLLYFHLGTRLNELIHLKWQDVDLQTRLIKIVNSDDFQTKTKQERIIPLNKTAYEVFRKNIPKIIDINGYVFTKDGFKFNDDYVSKQFKQACRDAGFPNVHTHILRHSFCSNLIKKNVPIRVVMELAGHSNLATTQRYMHVRNDSLFEAVKVLEG